MKYINEETLAARADALKDVEVWITARLRKFEQSYPKARTSNLRAKMECYMDAYSRCLEHVRTLHHHTGEETTRRQSFQELQLLLGD